MPCTAAIARANSRPHRIGGLLGRGPRTERPESPAAARATRLLDDSNALDGPRPSTGLGLHFLERGLLRAHQILEPVLEFVRGPFAECKRELVAGAHITPPR